MMRLTRPMFALVLLFAVPAGAMTIFKPEEFSLAFSNGRTPMSWKRGHAIFHTLALEVSGTTPWVERHLPGTVTGASISYSDIKQAHSWFGYRYESLDDRVRGEAAQAFVRFALPTPLAAVRPWAEFGTGPMWSNRRVPQATSRLNFNSFGAVGLSLFANGRGWPLRVGYRFAHVSNGGIASRNFGWNVHTFYVATRLKTIGRR